MTQITLPKLPRYKKGNEINGLALEVVGFDELGEIGETDNEFDYGTWPITPSHRSCVILNFGRVSSVPSKFQQKLQDCGFKWVQTFRAHHQRGEYRLEEDCLVQESENLLRSIQSQQFKLKAPVDSRTPLFNPFTKFVIFPEYKSLGYVLQTHLDLLLARDYYLLHISLIRGEYEVAQVTSGREINGSIGVLMKELRETGGTGRASENNGVLLKDKLILR